MLPVGNPEYLNQKPKIREHEYEYDKTIMFQYCNSHKELGLYLQMQIIWALAEILLHGFFSMEKLKLSLVRRKEDPLKGSPANTTNICGFSPLKCYFSRGSLSDELAVPVDHGKQSYIPHLKKWYFLEQIGLVCLNAGKLTPHYQMH